MLVASSACGASTKYNTLHINMNHSTKYATGNGGTDCETGSSGNNQEGISAYHLSLTKGNLLLSVLGGRRENWDKFKLLLCCLDGSFYSNLFPQM